MRSLMVLLFLGLLKCGLIGCASAGSGDRIYLPESTFAKRPTQTPKTEKTPKIPRSPASESAGSVDYPSIQRELGLLRPMDDLGYEEAGYNTCEVGYGYSGTQDCKREYMVVIHFQLMCRESEGTISRALSAQDMFPIANKQVKWSLKGQEGIVLTDSLGFGQIITTGSHSQKLERLKLAVRNEFLYMRAGEIKRVVTPRPWCN